jgi:hypothetical protein
MELGNIIITEHGKKGLNLAPVSGPQERATAHVYRIQASSGWDLLVAYAAFRNSIDVRCLEYSKSTPETLHRLTHGLRMSVLAGPSLTSQWAELSQARLDKTVTPAWSTLRKASEQELNYAADISVRAALYGIGGTLGTRADQIDDDSRRRSYMCTVFPKGNRDVPVAAYVLTRVLPLANGWS